MPSTPVAARPLCARGRRSTEAGVELRVIRKAEVVEVHDSSALDQSVASLIFVGREKCIIDGVAVDVDRTLVRISTPIHRDVNAYRYTKVKKRRQASKQVRKLLRHRTCRRRLCFEHLDEPEIKFNGVDEDKPLTIRDCASSEYLSDLETSVIYEPEILKGKDGDQPRQLLN